MKLLHTSDWHVGKTLRGASRLDEHRAVLGEIVGIAASESVDLVLVAGDLFESAAPAPDAQRVVWEALLALRSTGAHVVVIGGNHDHQHALDAFAPVFAAAGITVLGHATRPESGGVVEIESAAGERAVLVLVPFVSQRYAIRTEQMLGMDGAQTAGLYAERMRRLIAALAERFRPDAVNIVAAHGFVRGGAPGGGEREAQTVDAYGLEPAHFPSHANYVALGHLHRTQRLPGAAPMWYSGSPIQVDFGDEDDVKHVLVADVAVGVPAAVEARALTTPSSLRTLRGPLDQLRDAAPDVGDAWLRVFVQEPARAGLADVVRELLPRAVDVRIEATEPGAPGRPRARRLGRSPVELFTEYLAGERVADDRVVHLFERLYDEVTAEAGPVAAAP